MRCYDSFDMQDRFITYDDVSDQLHCEIHTVRSIDEVVAAILGKTV